MNWILLALIVVLAIFLLIKLSHLRHKIILIIVLIIFLSAYSTFSFVVRNNSIDIKNATGVMEATRIYFSWVGSSISNIKSITGNVVGLDWLPEKDPNSETEDLPRNVMRG